MSILFGYFDLGLRAMNAARLGLQVAGDNISNAATPGYARRRLELTPGFPVRVPGGLIDQGVEVQRIRRMHDRFVQASIERETGTLGFADERVRGLRDIESIFGPLDGEGVVQAYAAFSDAFNNLAAQPENLPLRRSAVASANALAERFRDTSRRLLDQRRLENDAASAIVTEVNSLAEQLSKLNRQIYAEEVDGTTAAPLRDQREQIVERMIELTGGTATPVDGSQILFSLSGGATLVTGADALPLKTTKDADGMVQIAAGGDGVDLTARLRGGKLGALLNVRDDVLPARLADLDLVAQDLIDRVNALTTSGFDRNGAPGQPLFTPIPSATLGAASTIALTDAVLNDPELLAISASGAPGDGSLAIEIARVRETASAALGGREPADYLGQLVSDVGVAIAQEDVTGTVSRDVLETLTARREATAGVSLDEEAVELIKNQRAYEAGARFLQVLNELTELTVNLV